MALSKLLMVLLLLSIALFIPLASCSGQFEAGERIRLAEEEVLNCYKAVYEAERAGANVSVLLNRLNEAGWLLSKAKQAHNYGDYGSAYSFANLCITKLAGLVDEAEGLKADADRAGFYDFMFNFVGSAFGAVAVVVGGYGFWLYLKRREKTVEV
ncbi:MAG: hypothetical protein QXW17_03990 [Candidatus Bathyarchaeia archaeon]